MEYGAFLNNLKYSQFVLYLQLDISNARLCPAALFVDNDSRFSLLLSSIIRKCREYNEAMW